MKIAVIGSGYVGLGRGRVLRRFRHERGLRRRGRAEAREAPSAARFRSSSRDLAELRQAQLAATGSTSRSNLAESIDGREVVFVAVGTPPHEDGSADLSHVLTVAEQVAESGQARPGAGDEEHRAGRHQRARARGRASLRQAQDQRGQQPRVLERGRRGQRLLEARSHRGRHRRRPRLRAPGAALRAVQPPAKPPPAHEPEERRDREVRVERACSRSRSRS